MINCDASYAIQVLVAEERPRSMLTGVVNSVEDPVIFYCNYHYRFIENIEELQIRLRFMKLWRIITSFIDFKVSR